MNALVKYGVGSCVHHRSSYRYTGYALVKTDKETLSMLDKGDCIELPHGVESCEEVKEWAAQKLGSPFRFEVSPDKVWRGIEVGRSRVVFTADKILQFIAIHDCDVLVNMTADEVMRVTESNPGVEYPTDYSLLLDMRAADSTTENPYNSPLFIKDGAWVIRKDEGTLSYNPKKVRSVLRRRATLHKEGAKRAKRKLDFISYAHLHILFSHLWGAFVMSKEYEWLPFSVKTVSKSDFSLRWHYNFAARDERATEIVKQIENMEKLHKQLFGTVRVSKALKEFSKDLLERYFEPRAKEKMSDDDVHVRLRRFLKRCVREGKKRERTHT